MIINDQTGCDRHTFAGVCAAVVDGMRRELAVHPDLEPREATAFLESHFGERTRPGGRLRASEHDYPDPLLMLPGENRPLPNPFRFVFQPPPYLSTEVPAIIGRAHGDLHTENLLRWRVDLAGRSWRRPCSNDSSTASRPRGAGSRARRCAGGRVETSVARLSGSPS